MEGLLYGSVLRVMECARLHVRDVDFEQGQIIVRDGKGRRDRLTLLPEALRVSLRMQIERVRALHGRDLSVGFGAAHIHARGGRDAASARLEFEWQYLFPTARLLRDSESGLMGRHHVDPGTVERAIRQAARAAGVAKRVTCHTFRHSFATPAAFRL
jgi:integrase